MGHLGGSRGGGPSFFRGTGRQGCYRAGMWQRLHFCVALTPRRTPNFSLARRAAYSGNTGSIFRSSTATLKRSLTRTRASTSRFLNMAPACGRILSAGVPEAARLVRSGGQLVFRTNSFLIALCMPPEEGMAATERLLRPAFGMYRVEWPGSPGVEFHLSHGDWIRLLRRSGFEVEDLIEVRPAVGATSRYPFVTLEWARQWPCEEVWKVRKTR